MPVADKVIIHFTVTLAGFFFAKIISVKLKKLSSDGYFAYFKVMVKADNDCDGKWR